MARQGASVSCLGGPLGSIARLEAPPTPSCSPFGGCRVRSVWGVRGRPIWGMIRASVCIMPAMVYTCLVRLRNASGVTVGPPGASPGGDSPGSLNRHQYRSSIEAGILPSAGAERACPLAQRKGARSGAPSRGAFPPVVSATWALLLAPIYRETKVP